MGTFDFEIDFVRDPPGQAPGAVPVLGDAVTLVTALREQLGLRVDRQMASLDVLVIESADRPTPS